MKKVLFEKYLVPQFLILSSLVSLATAPAATFGHKLPTSAADPCAYKYEYKNKWSTEDEAF